MKNVLIDLLNDLPEEKLNFLLTSLEVVSGNKITEDPKVMEMVDHMKDFVKERKIQKNFLIK